MEYTAILVERRGRVGLVRLNRPQALNALNRTLLAELSQTLADFEADETVGAVVITGGERVFAAGADIRDMAEASEEEMRRNGFVELFDSLRRVRKPVVAAVSGYALGGGCELALACDIILASETARFGLPEVTIGVIPGAGGTQRLTHIVGKYLAMEMILNNRHLTATEAAQFGLVNRVLPVERLLDESLALAQSLAERAPLAVRAAKQAVNQAFEGSLSEGLTEERDLFYRLFSTEDQKEGMKAFLEKRKPEWKGK
ncbi:MAG: enoyl-CoA hydratase-related protein [Anaerolineales bacterium]|nr:enoyl-CoA hydratase-related protein [Anaerolineales bacterium]